MAFDGQRRTYFHNVRFSPEEERILQKRKDKYRYDTVSDFIRAAALFDGEDIGDGADL